MRCLTIFPTAAIFAAGCPGPWRSKSGRTTRSYPISSETWSPATRDEKTGLGRASGWEPGTVVGQYRIEGELGRGGMGVVLRASDETLGRTVAIKVLRPDVTDPKASARLIHEARMVAKLRHDHVVTVHAVVSPHGAAPYLVMEHVDGETLAALIRLRGRLEPGEAADIAAQIAGGLGAAHEQGLIHRDVKPSNVLVEAAGGRAKLSDFGLARGDQAIASTMTREGHLAGTPTYMSPEQARGGPRLDHRSDIYSLGVTLYEALTGEVPFRGAPHMVFQQVIAEEPRPPRAWNDRVPRDLETICLKAMAKEPGRRYQSAGDFAGDLRRWQRGEPIMARPVGRLERTWRWCRRRPVIAGLTAALVVVVGAGFAGTFSQWRRAELERGRALRERDDALQQARWRSATCARARSGRYLLDASQRQRSIEGREPRAIAPRPVADGPGFLRAICRAESRRRASSGRAGYGPQAARPDHIDPGIHTRGAPAFSEMRTIFERLHETYPENPHYQRALAESCFREGECLRQTPRDARSLRRLSAEPVHYRKHWSGLILRTRRTGSTWRRPCASWEISIFF